MARHLNAKAVYVDGSEGMLRIAWSGDMGFGEYTIYITESGKWKGDSEYMDKGDDKRFLESLFKSIVEQVEIIS